MQLFLGVLDDGRLTDSQGRTVNFKNTVHFSFLLHPFFPDPLLPSFFLYSLLLCAQVIIMTSNIGASYLNELPDDTEHIPDATRDLVHGALRSTLPIEFINRIDAMWSTTVSLARIFAAC